jgi:hypothetical protein
MTTALVLGRLSRRFQRVDRGRLRQSIQEQIKSHQSIAKTSTEKEDVQQCDDERERSGRLKQHTLNPYLVWEDNRRRC